MTEQINVDDRVHQIHDLKRSEPAVGKTVRVESYDSVLYGNASPVFYWDPGESAPAPDTDLKVASLVDDYGPGGANEGAWVYFDPKDRSGVTVTSDRQTAGPGTYVLDTSAARRVLTIRTADAIPGMEIDVKREGAYPGEVATEGSASLDGQGKNVLLSVDRMSLTFRYQPSNNNWPIV